jgi:dienelactone hydrolase
MIVFRRLAIWLFAYQIFIWSLLGHAPLAFAQETKPISGKPVPLLPGSLVGGSTPSTMLRDSLHRQANTHFENWRQAYESRTELADIQAYQRQLRNDFIHRIGGLPGPAPLNPQITGTIERDGYRLEKILFESEPKFYVTAGLFLPDPQKFPPPWPAVVVLCGHSDNGKLQEGYQTGTALAAINGLAAMIVDPIGQGERAQLLKDDGKPAISGSTTEHTLIGSGAILVGWNTARWMIGDAMAAIDYLQSRTDIRGDRIGCMGNSGGGTQTSYLMALDPRVYAAAPSCYITSFKRLLETIGPQDAEQNIFGQIAIGMDHADYLMMRAPKPTLINAATQDFFDIGGTWSSYRDAKRLFQRLDAGRNIELIEVDAKHGWHPMIRRASVQFMLEHLAGRLGPIDEPSIVPLTAEEMNVTPQGQVLLLPDAVSTFDHLKEEHVRLVDERKTAAPAVEALRKSVRVIAGIGQLDDLPQPIAAPSEQRTIEGQTYETVILQVAQDIWLPGLIARPEKKENPLVTCLIMAEGKDAMLASGGEISQRVAKGETVLAIDIRGTGETRPVGQGWYNPRFGYNGGNAVLAYLIEKSLVGQRAEDVLAIARWLAENESVDAIQLVASGELTIPALHAAAVEPQLFSSVELKRGLVSWANLIETPLSVNQIAGLVHGALAEYDLPDLAMLYAGNLTITDAYDATDKPIQR